MSENIKMGRYDYKIEAHDIDFTGRVTYTSLVDYILKAAGDDADINGFGVSDLNQGNCSWVLSRMAVELYHRPQQYDEFSVHTWVSEINRLTTTRNMRLLNGEGELIAAAVTQWAVIDLDRRIAIDIRENTDYEGSVIGVESPIKSPKRIMRVEPTISIAHRVAYSDMDFNHHTNSTKYIEWMLDMLPLEWLTDRVIRRMDINFVHEALYGEKLEIGMQHNDISLFEVKKEDGTTACKVALEWSEK